MKKIIIAIILLNSILLITSEPKGFPRRTNSHIRIQLQTNRNEPTLNNNNNNNTESKSNCSCIKIMLTTLLAGTLSTVGYTVWRQESINAKISSLTNTIPNNLSITLPVTIPNEPILPPLTSNNTGTLLPPLTSNTLLPPPQTSNSDTLLQPLTTLQSISGLLTTTLPKLLP